MSAGEQPHQSRTRAKNQSPNAPHRALVSLPIYQLSVILAWGDSKIGAVGVRWSTLCELADTTIPGEREDAFAAFELCIYPIPTRHTD
jgi:hypothetical protein